MTRVDEAMRRALEQDETPTNTSTMVLEPASYGADISSFEDEPFPVEIREHRAVRNTPRDVPTALERRPPTVAPPAPALVQAAPVSTVTAPTAIPGSRLLERLDLSLGKKTVIDQDMLPSSREQYRRLAATLHHAQATRGLKVIMVSSAVPGEGKTLTSANIALTLSESYRQQVLLIDGDLRRPALHGIFQLENTTGLSDGLAAEEERALPVRQLSERLSILLAGRPTSDPMAGLTSSRMRRLLLEAREAFQWVIIDTPPVALLPDANLLSSMADGALLVVKAGSTPYELVKRAADLLGAERTLGVVLNRATTPSTGQYGYYTNYYYGATTTEVAKS